MTFLLVFLVVPAVTPSIQMNTKTGQSQIEEYRNDAEMRMRSTLGEVYRTVLIDPLKELAELESAGKGDVETIETFPGSGDKEDVTRRSVEFWKEKMEEVIKPYTTNPENTKTGQSQIEEYRNDAEMRMRSTLGEVYRTVLIDPLKELAELESAGKGDVETIETFPGSGDKEDVTRRSVEFWKEKMEEVIKPYTTNPEKYRGLIIDHAYLSEDPSWNKTAAYNKIAKELNDKAEEAFTKMENEYKKRSVPANRLEDVTETSWKNLQGKRALDLAVFLISLSRQFAKNGAASGGTAEELFSRLNDAIAKDTKDFMEKIQDIYK